MLAGVRQISVRIRNQSQPKISNQGSSAPSTATLNDNADNDDADGRRSTREDTTSKISNNIDNTAECAYRNKYKCCGRYDGEFLNCDNCLAYVHRSCHDKCKAALSMEIGHNNLLQISDDVVYCPKCQPDKLTSPNNNNNNPEDTSLSSALQSANKSLGTSTTEPSAIDTPVIPQLGGNSIKSTQDVYQSFPFKPPTPRNNISEVHGAQNWPPESGDHYGLDTFCYHVGRCSCGASNMACHKNTKAVKPILCNGRPRFVQSLSLKCKICNKTTMAYEKNYVDTLDYEIKQRLSAIIDGKSHGIDMSLIISLRNGTSAEDVERIAYANLYKDWSRCKRQYEESGLQEQGFPPFPIEYVPTAAQLNKAFLRDAESESIWLKRELAAMKSSTALSIDCQVKTTKRCVKKGNGMNNIQALSILGDTGIVLSHVVVPSDKEEYKHRAMEEVVARHNQLPKVCYVDKDCCNGKPGGRTDASKMCHGMEKKLDSTHLLARIGDAINPEHKRYATFMKCLSESIFTPNVFDLGRLRAARSEQEGSYRSLTSKEEKCEHVRRHIESGKLICSRIIQKVMKQAVIDKDNMAKYEIHGDPSKILTPSHWAFPLITTQVWKVIKQQLIHITNGCISDDGNDMHILQCQKKYKDTNTKLPVYSSTRGTSKNESFHSYVSAKSSGWYQIRPELYDARALWLVIHYNREKLRKLGRQALPNGISASESATNEVVLASEDDGRKVKFGFEYFNNVKDMPVEIAMRNLEEMKTIRQKTATSIIPSKHKNDYNLLDNIGEVPEEVELEDISRIGALMEQALPDGSVFGNVAKRIEARLPPTIVEECTESLAENSQVPVDYVRYPKEGKEADEDTFTRTSASTLTVDSVMPCLDMTGDKDLVRRQQTARDKMIRHNISLARDAKPPGGRDNNCKICFKNRNTFTFQHREHLQINKKERGVKLEWYCPLADPPEQYNQLIRKRKEMQRLWNKRSNEKRKAKRQKVEDSNGLG